MSTTIDRRSFVGTLGAATLAGTLPRPLSAVLVPADPPRLPRAPRVATLSEPGFPTFDTEALPEPTLREALDGLEATPLRAAELGRLAPDAFDVFLTPYGSAFPKGAWPAILDFLTAGGNWLNLGGVPLAVPVSATEDGWRAELRQTAYHKALGITQAFSVDVSHLDRYVAGPETEASLADGIEAQTVFALYYRLTREKEFPDEDGSDGPREAIVNPLLSVMGEGEHPMAVPVVRVDHLQGPFAGGRWVLANYNGAISGTALRVLVDTAARGAHELTVRPDFACYRDGETASISVVLNTPRSLTAEDSCSVEVFDDGGNVVAATRLTLAAAGYRAAATATLETSPRSSLAPGLYRVDATLEPTDDSATAAKASTGFWVFDRQLLAGGRPFTTDAHNLLRDGEPYVVTGTSYMAGDVHRRFLLEPNPAVWDRDFAAMKRAGINMIRTGIWTAWRRYMPEPGVLNEAALRALDAFLLTARRHDIPVIFTFFAFVPEPWGGTNPYLDPQAVRAQKIFISRVVQRYREVSDVIWDLINEPSCCSPDRLWVTRPNYDEHEVSAWREWLRDRFAAGSDDELASRLAELWRTTPDDALALPRLAEFGDRNIFEVLRPLKAMDYRLFANDVFSGWAREMVETIRTAGSPDQLITVGQDEGGTYERPGPFFHGPAVDFTSNHTWWLNDDLLWDSVVTKTPDRPLLISETGVMFYERIDGSAWRTEDEARDLLERKLVLALATDTAGFIEWIWNTNPYMPLDNEAAIGLLRPDGSAKPELRVLREIAAFARDAMRDLGPREPEPVVMVIPHSQMFSVRNFATEATQRCVRAMHYGCRVTMSAVGEYALDRMRHRPELVVSPAPRLMSEAAWQRLLGLAEDGATLLVTGPIDSDEHWRPVQRLQALGIDAAIRPVAQEEVLQLDDATLRLSFRGPKIQRLEKAVLPDSAAKVVELSVGRGTLLWSPLPVELAWQVEPTIALYKHALSRAGIKPRYAAEQIDPGVLVYPAAYRTAVLYALVSELGYDARLKLTDNEARSAIEVAMAPGRAALVLLDRRSGRVIDRYGVA
jgi:hypothetical protein